MDGADSYKVYYDYFADSSCSLDRGGRPRFCDELAADVAGTTFVHTNPDLDANYYWVVACNQEGCSEIDSSSPASPLGDGSGGPTSGGPCRVGVTLDEGDFCTVVIPGVQGGSNRFEVRNGSGCYGDICADESTNLNGFVAYASDGAWLIHGVPRGTSRVTGADPTVTPTKPTTPTATPTPTQPSTPTATPTHTPTPAPCQGMTLEEAIEVRRTEIVRCLAENSADVNARASDGNPLLHRAIRGYLVEIVDILVNGGANPSAKDVDGNPLLHRAIRGEFTEIVRILVNANADVNAIVSDGNPLLHRAIRGEFTDIVRILVEDGKANPSAKDSGGDPVLYRAIRGSSLKKYGYS